MLRRAFLFGLAVCPLGLTCAPEEADELLRLGAANMFSTKTMSLAGRLSLLASCPIIGVASHIYRVGLAHQVASAANRCHPLSHSLQMQFIQVSAISAARPQEDVHHRSQAFVATLQKAEASLKHLIGMASVYAARFCSGSLRPDTEAATLAMYLDLCGKAIPQHERNFGSLEPFAEGPGTNVGKYIRCLAEHPRTRQMAVFWYGAPGPNGVMSAALGFRAQEVQSLRTQSEGDNRRVEQTQTPFPVKLFTAEAVDWRCSNGTQFLARHRLLNGTRLLCKMVCQEDNAESCFSEVKRDFCPNGRLDVLAIDAFSSLPISSALEACRPRVILNDESGSRMTHAKELRADHGEAAWKDPRSWFHHVEQRIHAPALRGEGDFRIVVNRSLSGFLGESWDPSRGPRRFSIYMAVDANV